MSSTRLPGRARRRSAAELRLLVEAVAWLGAARICVTLLPFRHTARLLGLRPGERPVGIAVADPEPVARIAWAVTAGAARAPWSSTCMVRALAASVLLRRAGIARTLHLGVGGDARSVDGFAAHAWVAVGEQIVVGRTDERRYTAIASYS
jgi:Transglutaminase-like superfamily